MDWLNGSAAGFGGPTLWGREHPSGRQGLVLDLGEGRAPLPWGWHPWAGAIFSPHLHQMEAVMLSKYFRSPTPPPRPNPWEEISRDGRAQREANDAQRLEMRQREQPQRELASLRLALGQALARLPPAETCERYRLDGSGALAVVKRASPFQELDPNGLSQVLHGLGLRGATVSEREILITLRKELIGALLDYARAEPPGHPSERERYYRGPWPSSANWLATVRPDLDREPVFTLNYRNLPEQESLEAPSEPVVPRPGILEAQAEFERRLARLGALAPGATKGKKPK